MRAMGFAITGLTALVLGCGIAIRAGADFQPGTSFETYRTFGWGSADELPTGDPRLDNNPFFQERMRLAIADELLRLGFVYDERSPDLLVHYHASIRERVDVYAVDEELGYNPEYGPGTQVIQYDEGTILVDIADADSKRILWRGWAQSDLGSVIEDRDATEKNLRESMKLMFAELPSPPSR